MQQHSRPSPRSATPASNPTTNPERTNNSRDSPPRRSQSSVDLSSYAKAGGQAPSMAARTETSSAENQDKEYTRLNQIISHFHTKAALTICSSRASLPQVKLQSGEIRQDRWFNLLLDETDILHDDLYDWKRLNQTDSPAPPLELEIFLDTAQLHSTQALVLMDDAGKRWDVADGLASSADSSPKLSKTGARFCEVVLERWTIQLGDVKGFTPDELNDLLPNIYKKGVVFFRSLYTFLRFLPTWKLYRKLSRQPGNHQALRLKFRLRQRSSRTRKDTLYTPLCSSEHRSDRVVEHHEFPPIFTPSGPLRCSVEYRQNCAFATADAESLLSSRFLGLEESIPSVTAGRSLPSSHTDRARERYSRTVAVGGGLPARERPRGLMGAYGSLGTFHAPDKVGSPVSELRQRAEQADEAEVEGLSNATHGRAVPSGVSRRISVSLRDNPPFKAGSLASSPRTSPRPSPSPGTSTGKYEHSFLRPGGTTSSESSRRIPSSAQSQRQPRMPSSVPNETAVASSGSTSPKPAPVRYSSSFANRHKRFTSGGSKTADSNTSSARGSTSSKEKSGQLTDTAPGSSAGAKSDDDDIAAFISQIETMKDVKAFRGSPRTQDHVVNLAKYSSIRDTNTQLAEEMSSSSLIQTSTTPPSRRLSNVPGLSTSSSPSRAQPHVPYVRSRLSTHSIAEEVTGASATSREGMDSPTVQDVEEAPNEDEEDDEPFIFQQDNV